MELKLSTILSRLNACSEAGEWAATQPDLQTAWTNCKRSDWMLWLLDRTTLDRDDPQFRLMACDFAGAVLVHIPAGEDRPRLAIECARRFAAGEATREEMDAARDAAWDAAWDAARSAAWDAARSAAWSAAGTTAWSTAWSAAEAAAWSAAGAAAWSAAGAAAGDAAGSAAWDAAGSAQSEIIRRYFPECPTIKTCLLHEDV